MTLANRITLLRIALAPLILILLLQGQESRLGTLLDPLADKFLMVAVYPGLVLRCGLEGWVLAVFISRDVVISVGWALSFVLLGDATPRTRWSGKASTAGQMLLASLLLLRCAYPGACDALGYLPDVLVPVAVAVTAFSMLDYILAGSRRFGP